MFATFKRFALVVVVPAVVGLGVWAQWTTLTTKFAMLGASPAESAESIPPEITTDGVRPDARAADPEIKPAPASDRAPENGAVEQARPQAAKITVEPAQVNPAAAAPKVKRLPFAVERRPDDAAATKPQAPAQTAKIDAQPAPASTVSPAPQAKPEVAKLEVAKPGVAKPDVIKPAVKPAPAAEPRSVEKAASATKEPEVPKPQAQEKPTPKSLAKSEVKSEVKPEAKLEAKPDDRAARKENAAKREKTEQATQSRNGRSASRERPSRSFDPDDLDPRRALTELRRSRSVADFYDRLEALGWGGR